MFRPHSLNATHQCGTFSTILQQQTGFSLVTWPHGCHPTFQHWQYESFFFLLPDTTRPQIILVSNWPAGYLLKSTLNIKAQPWDKLKTKLKTKVICGLPLTRAERTKHALPQICQCTYLLCSRCISDGLQQECDLAWTRDCVIGLLQRKLTDSGKDETLHAYRYSCSPMKNLSLPEIVAVKVMVFCTCLYFHICYSTFQTEQMLRLVHNFIHL